MVNIAPEDTSTGSMKCGDKRHIAAAEQLGDAFGHFFGRLVGERDRQNVPGAHPLFTNKPGDTIGDNPRLARTGTGQNQQRSFAVQNGLFLRRVEVFEKIHEEVVAACTFSVKWKGKCCSSEWPFLLICVYFILNYACQKRHDCATLILLFW